MNVSKVDNERGVIDSSTELDAGALFVLQSRGSWIHCGFHLTTSIVGPVIFSLPFALGLLGWVPGVLILTLAALVTFYAYNLLSAVLEHHEKLGKRQIRFRDMARDILGPGWGKFFCGATSIFNMLWCCYCLCSSWRAEPEVHLLAVQLKWNNAAVQVHNYFWSCNNILGTNAIFPFSEAY